MPSVAQIDGLNIPGGAPAFTGLLDETYGSGAAAAYSVRRLASATTVLMRVRRETGAGNDGNDDEADVGFDSNNILSLESPVSNFSAGGSNATTLGQFLNVGTVNSITYTDADSLAPNTAAAYVDGWKDQSGNGNDAEQGTPANQPQIHDGTADTDLILENGKPTLKMVATDTLATSASFSSLTEGEAFIAVRWLGDTSSTGGFKISTQPSAQHFPYLGGQVYDNFGSTTRRNFNPSISLNQLNLYNPVSTSSEWTARLNSNVENTSATNTVGFSTLSIGTVQMDHVFSEFILFDSAKSTSDRTDIEDNINADYLIYQPTDQPTSGLLYDYGSATGGTDAAAAYSVRQLSDKAVLCMRIRRDMGAGNPGDDDEINIGFDANGDLDTQAISDFCGTGTGFVTRWWDQSVNGNHADQPVGGTGSNTSQPQIYNGTAVITENAKPALKLDGTNDYLEFPATMDTDFYYSVFAVRQSSGTDDTLLGSQDTNRYWADFGGDGQSQSTIQDGFNGGSSASTDWTIYRKNGAAAFTTTTTRDQYHTAFYDGNQILMSFLTDAPSLNSAFTSLSIGAYANLSLYFGGTVQEFIMYQSTTGNQSSNATGIETDIDTYYQIPGM